MAESHPVGPQMGTCTSMMFLVAAPCSVNDCESAVFVSQQAFTCCSSASRLTPA